MHFFLSLRESVVSLAGLYIFRVRKVFPYHSGELVFVNTCQHLSTDNGKTPHLALERHEIGLKTGCDNGWERWKSKSLLQDKKRIMQK